MVLHDVFEDTSKQKSFIVAILRVGVSSVIIQVSRRSYFKCFQVCVIVGGGRILKLKIEIVQL